MRFSDPTVPELDHVNWRFGRALIPDRTGGSTFAISGKETIAFGPLQQMLDVNAAAGGWPGAYPSTILAEAGLVGYWRLGELSGTVAVDSNARHDGVYRNAPTLGVQGAVGDADTAVTFRSADSNYVSPSFVFNQPRVTMEAWIKIASVPGVNRMITGCVDGLGSPTIDKVFYVGSDGKLHFYAYDGASRTVTSSSPVPTGRWVHVAGVADGTNLLVYINGAQVGSTPCGDTYTGYTVPNFWIGAVDGFVPTTYFEGSIDEVALYNVALPSSRLAAHVNAATALTSNFATANPYLKSALRQLGFAETVLS